MQEILLDFETFYDKAAGYSLQVLPEMRYLNDPRFEAYMMSVGNDSFEWVGSPLEWKEWDRLDDARVIAHNAMFERLVLDHLIELKLVPMVRPAEWFDTADLVAYLRVKRDLATASRILLPKEFHVSKVVRANMSGKHWADIRGTEEAKGLVEYSRGDRRSTWELYKRFHMEWPEKEHRLSQANMEARWRGIPTHRERLNQAIEDMSEVCSIFLSQLPWLKEDDPDAKPLSLSCIRTQGRLDGIPVPASLSKDSPAAMKWFADYGEKFPWVLAVRDYRKANIARHKLQLMKDSLRPADGRLIYPMKYYGANTGRFTSGSDKEFEDSLNTTERLFNVQNLWKKPVSFTLKGKTYAADVRGLLTADEGYQLYIPDEVQVEPRLLLWRAGDSGSLDLIRAGVSPYEAHARATMHWTGSSLKVEDPALYKLAKARILGCGYQCGGGTFQRLAAKYEIILGTNEAYEQVKVYRDQNPLIVGYWDRHRKCLQFSVNHGDPEHEIVLVSGRSLVYYHPHRRENPDKPGRMEIVATAIRGMPETKLYGGKLTENEIQALGRDVLRDGWLALNDAGFQVYFTTHDEYIVKVPERITEVDLLQINEILRNASKDWAEGCPLDVVGELSDRYR